MLTRKDEKRGVVVHRWTPELPVSAMGNALMDAAQALVKRVRETADLCHLRVQANACDACDTLQELQAEMRKIDLCLQQVLLVVEAPAPRQAMPVSNDMAA
jgi:hypothetical protein